jgi:beta-lactamase regulating signal transducer with metallopeptidase domain
MILFLLSGRWLSPVINVALQSLFLLAATAFVLVCARNASAARRHLISVAALSALFLMPLMALVVPAPKPLLRVSGTGSTLRREPAEILSTPLQPSRTVSAATASTPAAVSGHSSETPPVAAPALPMVIVSTQATSPNTPVASPVSLLRCLPWLSAFWLLGVMTVLGRLLIGWGRLREMARRTDPALSESLRTHVRALLAEVGFPQSITVLQARHEDAVLVPMTWGVRKAILLLPADTRKWPEERLRVVLLHELAHIRRYDWLTQIFGQIVCALYWFHPLVWLLNRHMKLEAERACDDAVLRAGVRAKAYAAHLLDVVRAMQAGGEAPSAAVAMARPRQVRYRMQSILDTRRSRHSANRPVRTLVLLVTGLLLCTVSRLRPFAWAGVYQLPKETGRITGIGPVVDLPNGISVELVGVGSKPVEPGENDWWTPDGKPLWELPATGHTNFAFMGGSFSPPLLDRTFFVQLHVTSPASRRVDISTLCYVVAPTKPIPPHLNRYARRYRNTSQLLPTRAGIGTFQFGLSPTTTRCNYRFGVAAGPWETIATTRLAPHSASSSYATSFLLDKVPHIGYSPSPGKGRLLSLLGDHAPLGEVARRLVALDKEGKEIYLTRESDNPEGDGYQFPAWAQARVVELRLQTCPYQWAEFKDIVLQHPPVPMRPVIATPPVLPAFRHTFACGITLSLPAVNEKRRGNALWWRPDGQPLSGPLKEYAPMVRFGSWGSDTNSRGVALRLTSPRTLSYTQAIRFAPSAADIHDEVLSGSEADIVKNHPASTWESHNFPRGLRSTTLRYGIAVGAWKTVASVAMPPDVRHASDNGNPNGAELGLSLPGFSKPGDLPTLHYTDTAGKSRQVPFKTFNTDYLPDVARRFVAVDKAGNVIPLPSNNGVQFVYDKAGKPVPLDPGKAGDLDLLVGEIQRRELDCASLTFDRPLWVRGNTLDDLTQIREFRIQIRPYEWAEFRNIALQPARGGSDH